MNKICVSMVCVAVMVGSSFADNITWLTNGTGSWSDGTKWSGGSMPDSDDVAYLNFGGNITIDSDVGTIAGVFGSNIGSTMVVNMTTDGSLTVTGEYELGRGDVGPTTFNMDGGSFTAGSMHLSSFSAAVNQLTISGGTFDVTGQLATLKSGTYGSSGTHTISVFGDAASISAGSVSMVNGYGAGAMATTLEFVFDGDGISTLNTGTFTAGTNSLLEIDLASYVYTGEQTFRLVDADTLTPFEVDKISVLNAGTLGYTVSQAGNDITLTVVPEPGLIGMLGLGAALLLFIRRKHR